MSVVQVTPGVKMVKHGQIFSADTQAVFYNWKQKPIQRMLDFDYLCGAQSSCASIKNMNAVISFCLPLRALAASARSLLYSQTPLLPAQRCKCKPAGKRHSLSQASLKKHGVVVSQVAVYLQ